MCGLGIVLCADVSKELEQLRVAGKIGSALAAEVELYVSSERAEQQLESFGDDLRFVFITSAARVHRGTHPNAVPSRVEGVGVRVMASAGKKCERCWHYRADTGNFSEHPQLCGRCVANLYGVGEARVYA